MPTRDSDLDRLLDEHQVSDMLQIRLATLRKWRLMGEGPRFIRLRRLVRYRRSDLMSWVAAAPSGGSENPSSFGSGQEVSG